MRIPMESGLLGARLSRPVQAEAGSEQGFAVWMNQTMEWLCDHPLVSGVDEKPLHPTTEGSVCSTAGTSWEGSQEEKRDIEKTDLPHIHLYHTPPQPPPLKWKKPIKGSLNPFPCSHKSQIFFAHTPWGQVQRLPLLDGMLSGPGGWVGEAHRGTNEEVEVPRGHQAQVFIRPRKKWWIPEEVTQLICEATRTKSRTVDAGPYSLLHQAWHSTWPKVARAGSSFSRTPSPRALMSTPHRTNVRTAALERRTEEGLEGLVAKRPFGCASPALSQISIFLLDADSGLAPVWHPPKWKMAHCPSHLGVHIKTDSPHFLTVFVYVTR